VRTVGVAVGSLLGSLETGIGAVIGGASGTAVGSTERPSRVSSVRRVVTRTDCCPTAPVGSLPTARSRQYPV